MFRMVHEPVKPVVGAQRPCFSKLVRSVSAAVPVDALTLLRVGSDLSLSKPEPQEGLPALSPVVACLIAVNRGLSMAAVPFCATSPAVAGTLGGMSAMLKIST